MFGDLVNVVEETYGESTKLEHIDINFENLRIKIPFQPQRSISSISETFCQL
jgi:hypothetical protein